MKLSRLKHYIKLYMPYKWVLEYEEKRDFFAQYFAWKETNPHVEFDKESKFDAIVAVCGMGYSGSGAVVDLLREYDDCLVHGMAEGGSKAVPSLNDWGEIQFIKNLGGLMDIDSVIDSSAQLYCNAALKRFASMIIHERIFNTSVSRSYFYHFFDSLIEDVLRDIPGSVANVTPRIKDNFFTLKSFTKQEYYQLCQQLINSVFNRQYDSTHRYLVLDQLFAPYWTGMEYCKNFIPNAKCIEVWRDPRDIYVIAMRSNISWIQHDTVEHYIAEKKRQFKRFNQHKSEYLSIRFEDLILDYDKTVANIENYLNLGEHKRPQSCLDTSISCMNIGMWKNAEDIPQDDFDKIYEELKEYCYEK